MSASASTDATAQTGFFASVFEAIMPSSASAEEKAVDTKEESSDESDDKEEKEAPAEEEEEEEEPEDAFPEIREECGNAPACAEAKHHFEACQEKVLGGKGWEGEDCVDEMFHFMHCVDACAVPKLWSKLV